MIAEYPIKLGLNPYGHKQREGDFRTPEGNYELVCAQPEERVLPLDQDFVPEP